MSIHTGFIDPPPLCAAADFGPAEKENETPSSQCIDY